MSTVYGRSRRQVVLRAVIVALLCSATGVGRMVANQTPVQSAQDKQSDSRCLSQKVAEGELSLFPVDGVNVPVYLVNQTSSVVFGRLTPVNKADIIVVTTTNWFDVMKEANVSRKPAKRGAIGSEPGLKIKKETLLVALSKAGQDSSVRTTLVDDSSFPVRVGDASYTVRVDTHEIKRFAGITVCRVS